MTVLQYVTEDFTGYNVLVTGASGVLGSGVAQALRDAGASHGSAAFCITATGFERSVDQSLIVKLYQKPLKASTQ